MRQNGVLHSLHGDHLLSTALTTNSSGGVYASQGYYGYGRYRTGGTLPTDHKFTGQKLDGTGLYYYGARYYNPDAGQFLSPDTLVPDPTNLFDYNRLMYVRGNPMGANDPTGHQTCAAMAPIPPVAMGCQIGEMIMRYGPTVIQLASQWADKLPAVDWLFSNSSAEQGTHSAGQQNAGNSSTGNPNGFDPKDPLGSFRNRGMSEQNVKDVQKAIQKGLDPTKAFQQYNDLLNKGIDMSGHALEQAQGRKISTERIVDTFTGAARNTQYFWEHGRVAQWSPHTNVAVIIEKATRQVVTVFERTSPQMEWQPMSAFDIIKWLQ